MKFKTIEELTAFVSSLSPAQKRRLFELRDEEMQRLPLDEAEVTRSRKTLFARAYQTEEEAASILAEHATPADTVADAQRYRLRQAEALMRASERLARDLATEKKPKRRRP